MGVLDSLFRDLEFHGNFVGGIVSIEKVNELADEQMTDEQKKSLSSELDDLKAKIADSFEEKESILRHVEMATKLRILISKRMKELKMIPQEYVDKYNEVVSEIKGIIDKQVDKDSGEKPEEEE